MKMKKTLRKSILETRKKLSPETICSLSRSIAQKIINMQEYQTAETVYCYIPVNGEVDTRQIIENAWEKGKKVAVPRIEDHTMNFYLITSYDQLKRGTMNIPEPDKNCKKSVVCSEKSIVVTPGIGYDYSKNRLGYGGGFYDRFFEKYPEIYKVAPAFSVQILPTIPAEKNDIKVDCIVSEYKII